MSIRTASLGAASLFAMMAVAGTAFADGMPSRGRIADAPAPRTCSTVGNVGLTTDYVYRGVSQSNEEGAVQGGVDFTCGRFYAGVWGSSIAAGNGSEVDIYGGYKFSAGPLALDVGFIYYAFPGVDDANYVELKLGASGEIRKGFTVGGTVYYSPDYLGFLGDTVTVEGTVAHALPNVGIFSPSVSGTFGHSSFDDDDLSYSYWNVGLTLGFFEKWSLDIRYWDTDGEGFAAIQGPLADDRVVGTIKYTF